MLLSNPNKGPFDIVIDCFDSVAWIPTIRGGLSLDVLNLSNDILGDVDKYCIEFKRTDCFKSEHYIAATSYLAFEDSRAGDEYCRQFRFVFHGSINVEEERTAFVERFLLKDSAFEEYCRSESILVGYLSIIADLKEEHKLIKLLSKKKFTESTVALLKAFQDMEQERALYVKQYAIDSVKHSELRKEQNILVEKWKTIVTRTTEIESECETDSDKLLFKFAVLLTRDGILFLKDIAEAKTKRTYFKSGTETDYTKNIYLNRVFKSAMNFMKYMFHKNYHHHEKNDTFLPAANLHPIKQSRNIEKVFRYQLEAFLAPIVKAKRKGFKVINNNSPGILLYAESFIDVYFNNGFIDESKATLYKEFVERQSDEVELHLSKSKIVFENFIVQNNIIAIVTFVIAIVLAAQQIHTYHFASADDSSKLYVTLVSIVVSCLLLLIYIIRIKSKQFRIRESRLSDCLLVNSNLNKKQFSVLYSFKLWRIERNLVKGQLKLNKKRRNVIFALGVIFLIIWLFFIIYKLPQVISIIMRLQVYKDLL